MEVSSYLKYLITIITLLIGLLILYTKWTLNYWKRKNVPHLEPRFLFGNFDNPLTSTGRSYAHYFWKFYTMAKEMGLKYAGIYCYIAPSILVVDPACIRAILVQDFRNFSSRGFYSNEKHQPVSVNLATSEGERWRNLRVKFTPTFTSAKMKIMFDLMVEVTKMMEEYIGEIAAKNIPLNATDCVNRYTTDIVGTCAFGLDCNSFKNDSFYNTAVTLMELTTAFLRFSFCQAFPNIAKYLGIGLYPQKEANSICNSIEETIQYRLNNGISKNDFLQILLELKQNNIININDLLGQSLLFFLGGQGTTSSSLNLTLFELALNEDIQEKLRNEIKDALIQDNGEVKYVTVMNMQYLEMIICESLRKYPSAPIIKRKSIAKVTLPHSNIVVEEGTDILIPVYGIHHDPEYFPDPDRFDPERFTDGRKLSLVPYSYLPFGEGPRGCIGDRFAKQQMKIALIYLIRRFRFKVNPVFKLPMKLAASFSLKPVQDIILDVEEIQ